MILSAAAIAPYLKSQRHPWQSLALFFAWLAFGVAVRHFKGEPNYFGD